MALATNPWVEASWTAMPRGSSWEEQVPDSSLLDRVSMLCVHEVPCGNSLRGAILSFALLHDDPRGIAVQIVSSQEFDVIAMYHCHTTMGSKVVHLCKRSCIKALEGRDTTWNWNCVGASGLLCIWATGNGSFWEIGDDFSITLARMKWKWLYRHISTYEQIYILWWLCR